MSEPVSERVNFSDLLAAMSLENLAHEDNRRLISYLFDVVWAISAGGDVPLAGWSAIVEAAKGSPEELIRLVEKAVYELSISYITHVGKRMYPEEFHMEPDTAIERLNSEDDRCVAYARRLVLCYDALASALAAKSDAITAAKSDAITAAKSDAITAAKHELEIAILESRVPPPSLPAP